MGGVATLTDRGSFRIGLSILSLIGWLFVTDQSVHAQAPAPIVTSVSPNNGPTAGGTAVTVSGRGFLGATAVNFGGTAAASFTVNSQTSITAISPTGNGTADVTVTTRGGTSPVTAADRFTYTTPPTVTSISPSTGPVAGGTTVTISGGDFTAATTVKFGGIAATSFSVTNPTLITATSPAGSGTVDVTVTTPSGTSSISAADRFSYVAAPAVTSISPSSGPAAGGTTVTISGGAFTGATSVKFGGVTATFFDVNNPTSITATAPAGSGTVDVTVTTPSGTSSISAADRFTYVAAPAVTSISPSNGPATGGTTVTISGSAFTGATSVKFGGVTATSFSVVNPTSVTATSPAGTGTVDVTVTTPSGTSAIGAADQFTYNAAPTVVAVSPQGGPPNGGITVIITGTNFGAATSVKFGGRTATFTVNSPTSITSTSPSGSGTVDVTVSNLNGTSPINAADRFAYGLMDTQITVTSSRNPSSYGQPVTFTARVIGLAPTGTIAFYDGSTQVGTATLTGTIASFTISTLAVGTDSITARYSGDANNVASSSAALIQAVGRPADSVKLRQMQTSVTPIIAQSSGQAISGAIDSAIEAAFGDGPQLARPNGNGFTFSIPLDQPQPELNRTQGGRARDGADYQNGEPIRRLQTSDGSLANGKQGGNGAPPGMRLIDMASIPLPIRSGMPPIEEDRFVPDELVAQFDFNTTREQIARFLQGFGLVIVAQYDNEMLGRVVYRLRILNGQSVRRTIRRIESERFKVAVQPNYLYRFAEDRTTAVSAGDPAQYVVSKLHLADAHQSTKGENVVVALIDSKIDFENYEISGTVTGRSEADCAPPTPGAHGTGMAGAIASHGHLLGIAPRVQLIAFCAFDSSQHPQGTSFKIIQGLNYAIQRQAKIVNMSFAGPRDRALSQALQLAREKGVLVVAAAGNDGPKASPAYPGADPNVLAVTAVDENDRLLNVANQGNYVAVAAPGVNVIVAAPGDSLQFTTGTSVAAAHVSGVAALLLSRKPSLKPEDVRSLLVATARHLGAKGTNSQFGAGLVDPRGALAMLISGRPPANEESIKRLLASIGPSSDRIDDGFSALGYATGGTVPAAASPPPAVHNWLAWIDLRGTNFSRTSFGDDLKGTQVNAIVGLTRKLSPNFLIGALGGYERFDFSSQAFNGVLRGEGWTTGAYIGWRLANLRFDTAAAWSNVGINETNGSAAGRFTGHRLLVTAGITGTYSWHFLLIEPSIRVYALWEREDGYIDTLGILQEARSFETGRGSMGTKVTYPLAWGDCVNLGPYAGFYSDYYFSRDDALAFGLTSAPLLRGWSGRGTFGVSTTFRGGAQATLGAEYSGIGEGSHMWTWRLRGNVPF